MSRLEESERGDRTTVFTFWFPRLVRCVLPAWIKYLGCVGALCCGVPWHPAQAGTEVHGTAGVEAAGASGFRNRNIINLRQNMVSCEGGDSVAVTLDCESPLWVPRQSPGLRWGWCGDDVVTSLGLPLGSWEGKAEVSVSAATTDFERWGRKRGCPTFTRGKSQWAGVPQEIVPGQHKGQRVLIPVSPRCPAARAGGFLCSPHYCQYLHASLLLYHEIETCHTITPRVIFWRSGELEQPK